MAETSKEQKAVLNILTDLGYRWKTKIKAMEHIPIENNERLVVLNIYPNKHLITAVTSLHLEFGNHNMTELKITDFKPKVIL